LYDALKSEGWIDPWLDKAKLLPGQDWEVVIEKAVDASDVVIICLSNQSVSKEGFVQREIRYAYDIALEKPEDTIFLIPLRLEDCNVPRKLRTLHWVDYFGPESDKSYSELLEALKLRYDQKTALEAEELERKRIEEEELKRRRIEVEELERKRNEAEELERKRLEVEELERKRISQQLQQEVERRAAKPLEEIVSDRNSGIRSSGEEHRPAVPLPLAEKIKRIVTFPAIKSARALWMGGGVLAVVLALIGFNAYRMSQLTADLPDGSETPTPGITGTKAPPTRTLTPPPTFTRTPTFTPTPGIGSTKVSARDGMELVYVPAGDFIMGADADEGYEDCLKFTTECDRDSFTDEIPIHTVYLDSYWIDKTEVTNAMFAKCEAAGKCYSHLKNSLARTSYYKDPLFDNYPVINVTWNDAAAYCAWAERRLPTEAEWEKAARGEDGKMYPWGDEVPIGSLLNYNRFIGDTTSVGTYPDGASDYGALDMAGNVLEWVNDWYDSLYYYRDSSRSNPQGPDGGAGYKVIRGGSFVDLRYVVRSANRVRGHPGFSDSTIGFRCALSQP
jgi:formylglycine-generating enzyme required for sulfatase activity